jgi:hypothetical protein
MQRKSVGENARRKQLAREAGKLPLPLRSAVDSDIGAAYRRFAPDRPHMFRRAHCAECSRDSQYRLRVIRFLRMHHLTDLELRLRRVLSASRTQAKQTK